MEPLYTLEDGTYAAAPRAVSPWNVEHQTGIAVAGLLVNLIEQAPAMELMLTTRLSIDIIRPVPMRGATGSWRIVRDGRRIQNVEATLAADGALVARCSALRVRLAETPDRPAAPADYPAPEDSPDRPLVRRHQGPLETRMISGGPTLRGPGAGWARPVGELVAGAPFTPLAAAAMAADIGSGTSAVLDGRQWSFANVALALHFKRAPVSHWIYIRSETTTDGNGAGLVDSVLGDSAGLFGRARNPLFIAPVGRSEAA